MFNFRAGLYLRNRLPRPIQHLLRLARHCAEEATGRERDENKLEIAFSKRAEETVGRGPQRLCALRFLQRSSDQWPYGGQW